MRERIQWIDTAKFLGIFAIYLGHMGPAAGNSFGFVFYYHVPLFFFVSGCMSTYDTNPDYFAFLLKKIKTLLIPFYMFSFLAIITETLYKGLSKDQVLSFFEIVLRGNIRNTFFAGGIWFLSCLFIIEIAFKLIKYLKNKYLILLVCTLLHISYRLIVEPFFAPMPSWPYNIDSAFYYIMFYALGYVTYPYIIKLFRLDTAIKKRLFILFGIISGVHAALIFFGIDYIGNLFAEHPILSIFTSLIRILLLIWFNLTVAKLFEKVELFNQIGRETLYLCGNEYIITALFTNSLSIIGIAINVYTPLAAYIYSSILLFIGIKGVIPFEKNLVKSLNK